MSKEKRDEESIELLDNLLENIKKRFEDEKHENFISRINRASGNSNIERRR